MSSRPMLRPYSVITDGNMASASITSSVTIIQQLSSINYAFSWSGTTPIGTIKVQASNDYSIDASGTVLNSGNWITLDLSYGGATVSSVPVTGNTGAGMVDVVSGAYALRVVYTKTSGVGTIQCKINAKVL
jgi:hypothetical protein